MNKTGSMWFDGGTYPGNPGNGGCGAVIKVGEKEYSFNEYLGKNVTNNRAEYGGLLLGMRQAQKLGITKLSVFGDSQLVVYQMDGSYSCRNRGLIPLWREAKSLASEFEMVTYNWIRRENNQKADAEATKAIESVVEQARIKIAEDLPICEPREGLKRKLESLNQSGEGAKFSEWLKLKSGRDCYSSLRGTALEELVPKEVRLAIAEALTDEEREEKIEPKVWRWYLRGLKPACALKKVRVDAEISANFRSK